MCDTFSPNINRTVDLSPFTHPEREIKRVLPNLQSFSHMCSRTASIGSHRSYMCLYNIFKAKRGTLLCR